ncbi:MAG: hypothetical protein Q7R49_03300 [Candidatus Daviesbacteria bacterium]|nr:hypothetical protein [Candidatus Daviesbacteria bacterium]
METVQQSFITEQQIVTPAEQIFERISKAEPLTVENIPPAITQSLDQLFPEQQHDEKRIKKAKETLGPLAEELSAEELKESLSEMQFLVNSWIDEFERSIFEGKTLNELLNERGGK